MKLLCLSGSNRVDLVDFFFKVRLLKGTKEEILDIEIVGKIFWPQKVCLFPNVQTLKTKKKTNYAVEIPGILT